MLYKTECWSFVGSICCHKSSTTRPTRESQYFFIKIHLTAVITSSGVTSFKSPTTASDFTEPPLMLRVIRISFDITVRISSFLTSAAASLSRAHVGAMRIDWQDLIYASSLALRRRLPRRRRSASRSAATEIGRLRNIGRTAA